MVSKKDILKWLINDLHFENRYNDFNCHRNPGACYYVEVTSRSKIGWTHVFFNHKGEILKFNLYFMTFIDDGSTKLIMKLNKNNEANINSILKTFTGVDVPEIKKNLVPNFTVKVPYIGCTDPMGEDGPDKEIHKIIRTLSKYGVRKHDYETILNTITNMCQISYENGMQNEYFNSSANA